MKEEILKASSAKIAQALKAYKKALGKQAKTRAALDEAIAQTRIEEEAYLSALKEAKEAIEIEEVIAANKES